MALFKILRGESINLADTPVTDGFAYFTPEDGKFYIDYGTSGDEPIFGRSSTPNSEQLVPNRICINDNDGVYQPLDADLTAIADLTGTTGLLRKTAADTWTLDTTALGDMTIAVYGGSTSGVVAKSDALKETRAGAAEKVWVGTKAQYNAIVTKDAETCYITTDETYGSYISLDETGHILASYMPLTVSDHMASTSNPHGVTKSQVGLGNVNNTADIDKPISLYVQAALDLKAASNHTHSSDELLAHTHSTYAPINNPTFTGNVSGITAAMVGLGNVTNESKSTMFTNPTFTGNVSGITAAMVGLGNVTNESKSTMFTNPTFTGTVSGITATMVGLGNVTNESKSTMFTNPTFTGTVSGITATMVGLGNVTNESKSTMFTNPTFTGVAKATGNTSYTTSQLRNVFLNTTAPTSGDGSNGDIWIIYT